MKRCITDVPGIRVGHAVSAAGHTGCTVVLVEQGAIAGVDIGGSAPGMRETEMLNPTNMVMRIHAVLLTGGSTFGLNAAGGVQQFLQERGIGFTASTGVIVPIVPTAVIFDLDRGARWGSTRASRRPTTFLPRAAWGWGSERRWERCSAASTRCGAGSGPPRRDSPTG
jgi:L-aminopeptidase/D-esterase-like protein